jgi:hypothetical protein
MTANAGDYFARNAQSGCGKEISRAMFQKKPPFPIA